MSGKQLREKDTVSETSTTLSDIRHPKDIKLKGLLATSSPNQGDYSFTDEALKQMAEQSIDLPLTVNFDRRYPIGKVSSAKITEKGLEVAFTLDEKYSIGDIITHLEDLMFIVPGGEIKESHQEGDVKVIDALNLTQASLVVMPADPTLTPIQKDINE